MKSTDRIKQLIFLSALLLPVTGAWAAGNLDVRKDITVDATGEEVWSVISDYCAIAAWHPAVVYCDKDGGNNPGTLRVLTLGNGEQLNERLLRHEDDGWNYAYTAINPAPVLPVMDYDSSIQVRDMGGGRSLVVWEGSFNSSGVSDSEAVAAVSGVFEGGLDMIRLISESMK